MLEYFSLLTTADVNNAFPSVPLDALKVLGENGSF